MHRRTSWLYSSLRLGSAWWLLGAATAHATPTEPTRTWYVQTGVAEHSAYAGTLGLTQTWSHPGWRLGSGQLQGHWDAFASGWSGRPSGDSRRWTAVLGIGPSLRWRAGQGHAPWFVELGTAASYSSRHWHHETRRLSTRWNFASHAGVGWNWGPQRQHEVSVRLQHSSNAGIKHPNPGADFVLLRYARRS